MVNLFWIQKGEYILPSKNKTRGKWDYSLCARETHDSHVIKIALEATQLLYSAHHKCPMNESWRESAPLTKSGVKGYNAAHMNNPISIWLRSSIHHYRHTVDYGIALCKEYTFRFEKEHACETHLKWLKKNEPIILENLESEAPLCMPEQYKPASKVVKDIENGIGNEKSNTKKNKNSNSKAPLSKRRRTSTDSNTKVNVNIPNTNENKENIENIKLVSKSSTKVNVNIVSDSVMDAYCRYYIGEKLKVRLARWSKREIPVWIQPHVSISPQIQSQSQSSTATSLST